MNIIVHDFFYFWLIVSILFLLLEMGSPGLFYFLSFFCGSVVAAIASLWTNSLYLQGAFFFMGSVCALVMLRQLIMPLLSKGRPHERTNVYGLVGKRAFVLHDITKQQPGLVSIEGSKWIARSVGGESIVKGNTVEVVSINGAHVVVKKI